MQFQEPSKSYSEQAPLVSDVVTPAAEGADHNGVVLGKWKAGLLQFYSDCIPNGFMAFVCPGVSVAQICARLGFVDYYAVLFAFACFYLLAIVAVTTGNDAAVTLIVVAAVVRELFVARLRWLVRYLFSLPGSVLEDVLCAFVCEPCAIAQMATHVGSYKAGDCDIAPRTTLPGYSFA